MSRTILSRSQLVLMGAVATLVLGVTAVSANGLNGIDVSTSYGGGHSGDKTSACTHDTGSSVGASTVNAGGGLGYSQTRLCRRHFWWRRWGGYIGQSYLWGGNGFGSFVSRGNTAKIARMSRGALKGFFKRYRAAKMAFYPFSWKWHSLC